MNTSIITTANLDLAKDEEIRISSRKKYEPKTGFNMTGNGEKNSKYPLIPKSIDALKAVADMTMNEKLCFFAVKDSIKWDRFDDVFIYQTKPDLTALTETQRKSFIRGYKLLFEKDIIRRVSRGEYMISPLLLVPKQFEKEFATWSTLSSYKQKEEH